MDLADIKARSRAAVHSAMSTAAQWSSDKGVTWLPAEPNKVQFSARWHNKLVRQGDEGGEYMDVLEGVDRLVFNRDQLETLGISLSRGDLVRLPKYGITYDLDQPEPGDGPANVYWHVTRA